TEPEAAPLGRDEWLEEVLGTVLRETATVVADLDANAPGRPHADADRDAPVARVHALQSVARVAQEIQHDLLKLHGVGGNRRHVAQRLVHDLDVVADQIAVQQPQDLLDDHVEIHGLELRFAAPQKAAEMANDLP